MDIYKGQDFFTPGAAETVDLISCTFALDARARVIEVAYGTGEGACRLAERHGWRVVGVDMHPFAAQAARRTEARGAGNVSFVIGDGGRLPVRDGAFDGAICIGAPSIVGTERCLAAMRCALRRGGWLAVSDWVWRATPVPPAAIPSGFDGPTLTLDEYAVIISAAGFDLVSAEALPGSAWDDYYAPIRKNLAAMHAADPEADFGPITDELRVWDSAGRDWWQYGVFVARAV